MKRLLYYTYWSFANEASSGICKKIRSQVKVFEDAGFVVDFAYLIGEDYYIDLAEGKTICLQKKTRIWTKPVAENRLREFVAERKYDCVYMRYNCSEYAFIGLIKQLKKAGSKIFIEIPTFPYDGELTKSLSDYIYLTIDRLFRGRICHYADRIVTFHGHKEIFHLPTIETINGMDVSQIPLKQCTDKQDELHLICVAIYSLWHGLERVLLGMADYYSKVHNKKVYLHIVGEGPSLPDYERIVKENHLDDYVVFHGRRSGTELDVLFDQSDIAIETLGWHRTGLTVSSTIKSREYLCRGIPYAAEVDTDILPKDWPYLIKLPYDESAIDIDCIVKFYDRYMDSYERKVQIAKDIRSFAFSRIDMKMTMKEIIQQFEEG